MVRSSRCRLMAIGVIASLAILSTPPPAAAQNIWTGAGIDYNWSNPSNWQGSSVPVSGALTRITFVAGQGSINNLGSPFVLTSLQFNTGMYVIGGQLDFQAIFNNTRQIFQNTALSLQVENPLLINGPLFMRGSGGVVTLSGAITGGGSFNQGSGPTVPTGTFVTELWGLNSYTGGTFVHNGTLRLRYTGTLPAGGNVTVTAGTLNLVNDINLTIGSLTLSSSDATGTSPAPRVTGNGILTLGGNIAYKPTGGGDSPGGWIEVGIDLGGATRTIHATAFSTSSYDLEIRGAITDLATSRRPASANSLSREATPTAGRRSWTEESSTWVLRTACRLPQPSPYRPIQSCPSTRLPSVGASPRGATTRRSARSAGRAAR